jgi:phosphoglycolate phosphatase-like HAD superfamily hydrolase
MSKPITSYRSLVFDCDGVLLNSNKAKTEAFRNVALPYGEEAAQALVDYHVKNGGVSRYKKFAYFLEQIVPGQAGPGLEALLEGYARQCRQTLETCEQAAGLAELRRVTAGARWLVVSGGDQEELRAVFAHRGLDAWFDGGIFGSPGAKDDIVERERDNGNIRMPAVLLGDSRFDHLAARRAGLDFVFVSGWTELAGWRDYCEANALPVVERVADLLPD